MTRKQARCEIDSLDFYLQNHTDDYGEKSHTAMMMAKKALEQDDILDKIRAELHATAEMHEDGNYYLRDEWIGEIFDKYKAESEESNDRK